eukprot:CAMPEP_0179089286 /NCGR_PEP_ID=MMETSP0796-20121207/40675_1 /TAXON_ID=73915 /ORGANISM="Pyrodinium bahamense, Strain pbaha01" /LENGTH=67 /DNA_ID=CAMNT_0020786839 /DNA_START=52 /DNA_END=253 /DNA_ORIENTATION=+
MHAWCRGAWGRAALLKARKRVPPAPPSHAAAGPIKGRGRSGEGRAGVPLRAQRGVPDRVDESESAGA